MVMPGGGGSLGTAQGRITIDVSNVQQAATVVKQAAAEMTAAFNAMNQAARTAAQGVGQIATATRRINQNSRSAATAFNQVAASANNAGKSLQTLGTQAQQGTTQVATGVKRAQAASDSLGQSLQRLGGQFFVFSVAAGVLVAGGIRAANTMETMAIRFRALEGSSEAAEKRIAGLTQEARKFNLPLTEVLAGIARLQPLLKQTGNETNRFVGLVARLATVNPVQGAEGAAIAIGEALSGTGNDFYSLQERFNIPRNLLRQAIAETDNFADALDRVLNQLGATNETAIQFGNTFQGAFRAAKDELMRLIGEGLRPFLRAVTPIIRGFADIAARINEGSPFLATMLSTTLLITAAMAPLLYAMGKFVELWKAAAANAALTATAQRGARLAGAGLAAAAGFELGQSLYSGVTGESRQSVSDRLNEFFAQSFALIMAALESGVNLLIAPFHVLGGVVEQAASAIRYFIAAATKGSADLQLQFTTDPQRRAELGQMADNAATTMIREFLAQGSGTPLQDLAGRLVIGNSAIDPNKAQLAVGQALIGNFEELGATLDLTETQIRNAREAFNQLVNEGIEPYTALGRTLTNLKVPENFNNRSAPDMPNFMQRVMDFYNNITGGSGMFSPPQTGAADGESQTLSSGFNTEQVDAFRRFKEEMAQLEADYNDNVLRETQQYYTRRNDIILDYNEKVIQAQEDENRRRQEAEEDLAREIADVQEESAKEQIKARKNLEDEIAKVLRESRIRVLEAASRLDARAVFEEQRRTRARIDEMRNEYDEEAQERQQQAADRIKNLQDEFQREQAKRAEDFQRRLADMERQKNRELQQLQQQHYNRLSEMQNQYNRERSQRNQAFATELNDLAGHSGRVLTIHRTGMFTLEYELLAWYQRMQRNFSGGGLSPLPPPRDPAPLPGRPVPTPYQTGTSFVPATDIYKLHAGEGVMTPAVNQLARSMLGGNYTQAQLAGLLTSGGQSSGASYDFSGMQIVLGDVGNRSNADVAAMIEDGLYQFFVRAAQTRSAQTRVA